MFVLVVSIAVVHEPLFIALSTLYPVIAWVPVFVGAVQLIVAASLFVPTGSTDRLLGANAGVGDV